MDKNKSRNDMLAAGRKKLQQFRQKKDNKGGGSLEKISSKATKQEKDGAAEESFKMPEDSSVYGTDLSNANQPDFLASGTGGAEEVRVESEQQPAGLDYQEVDGLGLDRSNGSRLVDSHEVPTKSCPAASEKNNLGGHDMEEGGMEGESTSGSAHEHLKFQEANGPSFHAGGDQGEYLDHCFSYRMDGGYLEENQEKPASSQTIYVPPAFFHENDHLFTCANSESISNKEKKENHQQVFANKSEYASDLAAYALEESEVENQSFGPVEESQKVGIDLSGKPDEDTFLWKSLETPSSLPNVSANEDGHNLVSRTSDGVIDQCLEALLAWEKNQDTQPQVASSFESIAVDSLKGLPYSLEHKIMDSSVEKWSEHDGVLKERSSVVDLESIRKHLYLSYLAKDVLHLQLLEQIEFNEGFHHHSSNEMKKLLDIIKEAQLSEEILTAALVQCKSEIKFLTSEKDEMETKCLSARKEIEEQHIRCFNLESELRKSQEDLLHLSEELAISRSSLGVLQKEKADLLASFVSETDAKKKLIEEVGFLSSEHLKLTGTLKLEADARKKIAEEKELLHGENINLLDELSAQEERLQTALNMQNSLQHNLREIGSCFEQLTVENFYLSSCLDIQKEKIKEMETRKFEPTFYAQHDVNKEDSQMVNEGFNVNIASGLKLNSQSISYDQGHLHQKADMEESNNCYVFMLLNKFLLEAKSKLQILEKSLQGMHLHSMSWRESSGKTSAAGVSKLIKEFESKAHVGSVVDEGPLDDGEKTEDSYSLLKEQVSSLKSILDRLESELGKLEIHVMGDPQSKEVLEKFEMDYESLNLQSKSLQLTFEKFAEECESKINDLQNHVDSLHRHVNDEAVEFSNQIELLQTELIEDASILKQERDVMLGMIFEAIGKLDASIGLKALEELDVSSHVMASVDAAILGIETMHDKLEAANRDYNLLHASCKEQHKSLMDMKEKYSVCIEILDKYHNNLMNLVNEAHQNARDAAKEVNVEEILVLMPEKCEMVVNFFERLLNGHSNLLCRNNELVSELLIRNQEFDKMNGKLEELFLQNKIIGGLESSLLNQTDEIQEVKRRCLVLLNQLEDHESGKDLYAHARSIGGGDAVSKDTNDDVGTCNSLLSRLEDLIAFHLNNYEEVLGQINMSRQFLKDANVLMELSPDDCYLPLPTLLKILVGKLHEKLHLLTVVDVQKESEIQILKEAMSKVEEDVEACRYELERKASEVEQSEQKLSSVREKLGIAVSKGKGLIVQRDGLKQFLMEKSIELENCAQELLSKEALIHELEAKLTSCSEFGRIEALESELSYIRNSATALRDSFLQKDSILQRFEEVLESFDLPDDFHDKDIIEKIELLSRFVIIPPSSTLNDWDKKVSEKTHSDLAGFVMEADMVSPTSNQDIDELKIKLEELQGRLFGLSERNYMLEQSLLERNSIVQQWEEFLDSFDMPSYMRTVEPEKKIEWLQREVAELKQERDSLQLKIDNLEISSEMLIVDLEESHKKISELTAEVAAVKSEKEFFSDSLKKLRFEYLALSEKAVHDELDRENLQRELAAMHDKLCDTARLESYRDVENSMQKLYDLVSGALEEGDKLEFLSDGTLTQHLEVSLKKLIDSYTDLLKRSNNLASDNMSFLDENSRTIGNMVPEEMLYDKEQELASVKLELERASSELVLQERDKIHEKCQLLILEIEDLKLQIHSLNIERNSVVEKHRSVVLELDAMRKLRDSLQEQLTQEEQKSAAVKEKLNLAVRKGKGLVQQRDSLKLAVDEMNALVEQLKGDCNQQIEVFESEKSILMNQLAELELNLWGSNQKYGKLLAALHALDIKFEADDIDPVQMVGVLNSVLLDLRSNVTTAEHEANKSKRTAELLLAELNEIQERNDILQDEVAKVETSLVECSKQKDDSLSRLEQIMSVYSEEKVNLTNSLVEFNSGIHKLRGALLQSFRILSQALGKDTNFFRLVEDFRMFIFGELGNTDRNNQLFHSENNILPLSDPKNEEMSWSLISDEKVFMHPPLDGTMPFEHLALVGQTLHQCMHCCEQLREHISNHSVFIEKETAFLLDTIDVVKRRNTSLKDTSESLKGNMTNLEAKLKEKDAKIGVFYQYLALFYEACSTLVLETMKRKPQITENSNTHGNDVGKLDIVLKLPSYANVQEDEDGHFVEDCVKAMADSIVSIIKDVSCTNELVQRNEREFEATISALQREFQEKDLQLNKICEELASQKGDAEAVAKKLKMELDFSRTQISNLDKKVESMETDRKSLELRLNEVQDLEACSVQLKEKINSLIGTVNAKDQEIEDLMHALDEEEAQMEALEKKNSDLENVVQEKVMQLEALHASNAKTTAKLSTTVSKFDELHNLSESLLAEIENLQSQVQDRDSEISFLRQEVTRCTNDVLASQGTSKKHSSQVRELLAWMRETISSFGEPFELTDGQEESQVRLYINILGMKIASAITGLDELHSASQSKDALLEIERGRFQELLSRFEVLQTSLNGKERLEQTQGERASEKPSSSNSSGTLEIEHMVQRNKASSVPITIRSGRKVNNDQIAIAIDPEKDVRLLEDEDDDKAHGFKPLTMSRLIPRATRPIVDRIDGIWVSAERLLMRQPTLRLALFLYWVAIHALLASFI